MNQYFLTQIDRPNVYYIFIYTQVLKLQDNNIWGFPRWPYIISCYYSFKLPNLLIVYNNITDCKYALLK